MNTLEFLQSILPDEGVYYLVAIKDGKTGHTAFTDLVKMAAALERFDAMPGVSVYHACASYHEPYIIGVKDDGSEKRHYRIPKNQQAAKAFWIDVDCGLEKAEAGKGYATKREAAMAVDAFRKACELPVPTIVDSGNGLHFYWPLTYAITPEAWTATAQMFKSVLAAADVLADPSRTADFASILRPVGSHNRKNPDSVREVRCMVVGTPIDQQVFAERVASYGATLGVKPTRGSDTAALDALGAIPSYANGAASELEAHGYPTIPVSLELIATKCSQVCHVRDTGGTDYESWRLTVGLATFCTDGDVVADWSAKYDGYDPQQLKLKRTSWNSGPTTCAGFKDKSPERCNGCEHAGKIITPLVLGRVIPDQPAGEVLVEAIIDGESIQVELPKLPRDFIFDQELKQMVRFVQDAKSGVLRAVPFCNLLFYPTVCVVDDDSRTSARINIHMPRGKLKTVELPMTALGAGGSELRRILGGFSVFKTDNKDAGEHLEAYIRNSINKLMAEVDEMETCSTYGWSRDMDSFLLGDIMYMTDGTKRKVIVGGLAQSLEDIFTSPRGSAVAWGENVALIYDRPGMEPMQYALCSSFGSVLGPFGEESYHGIPVSLSSSKPGNGKTTCATIGISAWGDVQRLRINGVGGQTVNARYARMGAMNNIPMLMDELTLIESKDLSPLLYAMSNGLDRERMHQVGNDLKLSKVNHWNQSSYITANSRMTAVLASNRINTKAQSVRLIEIHLDEYKIPLLDIRMVGDVTKKILENSGMAGRAFIEYVVFNKAAIKELWEEYSSKLYLTSGAVNDSEYRFYRQHMVCTLTAARILYDLGIVRFDLAKLTAWALKHIEAQCQQVAEANESSASNALSSMINALTPQIICTYNYNEARGNREEVRAPHDVVVGRYVFADSSYKEPMAGKLFLSIGAVRDWCHGQRLDFDAMLAEARKDGYLLDMEGLNAFNLTRGTQLPVVKTKVFCFDHNRMSGVTDLKLVSSLVASEKREAGSSSQRSQ